VDATSNKRSDTGRRSRIAVKQSATATNDSVVAFDVIILVFSQYALQTFINAAYIVLQQQMTDDILYAYS
jgi:hypothetical protein